MSKLPHYVTIRWGLIGFEGEEPDIETYKFYTKKELNAFMAGIEAADGWLDHKILEDSREKKND